MNVQGEKLYLKHLFSWTYWFKCRLVLTLQGKSKKLFRCIFYIDKTPEINIFASYNKKRSFIAPKRVHKNAQKF